jgi:cyclopropane-fatty-acyl-phospholipid synthase
MGAPLKETTHRWSGVGTRIARRLVLDRLRGLQVGRVSLEEGADRLQFGQPAGADLAATIRVHDPRFYRQIALGGSLGAAEAYLRGYWTSDDLTTLLRIFVRNLAIADRLEGGGARLTALLARLNHWLRRNTRSGSRKNIEAHYDLGNEFFALFLDETMTYSCGIFERPESDLAEASLAKLDRICRKLDLTPSDHVVEIGTGWGSFAMHAATQYGCRVTTTTVSPAQRTLAQERIEKAGVEDRVEVLLCDYRDLSGRYDKLVSIEMIEAVGEQFLEAYFRKIGDLLTDDGLAVLQAITMPDQRAAQYRRSVDFIQAYVFPGSFLPSIGGIVRATARATDLKLVHLEDITPHYTTTLRLWRERFLANLEAVKRLGYPDRFLRLWEYYLCYCEAGFAERYIGDVQLTFAKPGCRRSPILGSLPRPEAR